MTDIQGYSLGEINCKAAFTSEFVLDYDGPLQNVVNMQEEERRTMDTRPGMYLKYLPCRYDTVTGQLFVGGGYLFDSQDNVKEYDEWTTNTFEVGLGDTKTKFWSRPLFKDVRRRSWNVIGACNFTLPDQHAVVRFQRWTYSNDDVAGLAPLLRKAYSKIRNGAEQQGLGAIWLLIRPSDRLIGIVTTSSRTNNDSDMIGYRSVADLEHRPSLEMHFPSDLDATLVYDRTSFMLTTWLPISRRTEGVPQVTPNFPILPAVTVPPQTI